MQPIELKRTRSESFFPTEESLGMDMKDDKGLKLQGGHPPASMSHEILEQLSIHRQRLNDISEILMSNSLNHKGIVLQEIQYYQEGVYMLLHGLNASAPAPDDEVKRAVSSLKDDALEVLHWLDSLQMC